MKRLLFFISLLLLFACSNSEGEINKGFIGEWSGNIEIPESPLFVILELDSDDGSLSVPIQGLENYPFEEIAYDDNEVTIKIDLAGSRIIITGALEDEKITGTFTQDGQSFPIQLDRHVENETSYEEIQIPVADGELNVALEKPESEGPHEVAIIIAGSGPTDKDGNTIGMGKNDSLKMLAEQLADEGIASIRYDKRGIGANASLMVNEEDLRMDHYVNDVKQIIDFLQTTNEWTNIHIIGHSEGALIGMLAIEGEDITTYTSLAGAGKQLDRLIYEQLEDQLTGELFKEANSILINLKKGKKVDHVSSELHALFRPSVQAYLMSTLQHDPAEVIKGVDVRTIIIQGTTDLQVPVEDAERLKESNDSAELVIVEGMNHVLKEAPLSEAENIATYTDPTIPLSSDMMNQLLPFLKNE